MSMPGFASVDTDGIRKGIQVLGDTAEQLNGDLRNVNGLMGQLQASWRGNAATTYFGAMDAWENNLVLIIKELMGMIEKLGGNTQEYDVAEQDAESLAPDFADFTPMALS